MNNSTEWEIKQEEILKKISILRTKNKKMIAKLKENPSKDPILERVAYNMDGCGTFISFAATEDNKVHINAANFCRERLCAICAWRRQAKFIATTYPALEHLAEAGYKLVFTTLTFKNVRAGELSKAISAMLRAYTRLSKQGVWKGVLGAVRSLEVTYNAQTRNFHPHIHAILIMRPDYSPLCKDYIAQSALSKAWKKAAGLDYIPVTDIRLLKSGRKRKAYIEVLKYALKPADIPAEYLEYIYYALKGRRLISFSGILKNLRRNMTEDILTDKISSQSVIIAETIYKLNATGGLYEIYYQSRL